MSRVAVARHTRIRGFDGVREKVPDAYEVLDLREALERRYQTDAHLVAYVVPGAARQPRINKSGLPHFGRPVQMGVFLCDVDNPDHALWTDETLAESLEQYDHLEVLQTAGVYHTARGRRIVQPIEEPIAVEDVEPYIRRWFLELERAGLAVDWSCRDWTRHYRLPHVVRDGVWYRSPFVDLRRMRPIALEALPAPSAWQLPSTTTRAPSVPTPAPAVDWSAEIPSFWHERVETIAAAVREVQSEWHTLFLALAGAMMSRGVPAEHVPALCRAISNATGADTRTDDREAGARSTVQRRLADLPATGYGQLAAKWPEVAEALDEVTASGTDARMRALAGAPAPDVTRTLEETCCELEQTIRAAPPGVTLISAECGLGKTRTALVVAAERAAREHASPDAAGARAPLQSKTSISVDKNALAVQIQHDPELAAVGVKRVFGPLSLLRPDGTPECRFHDVAQPLVAGGQSMQRELCEGRGRFKCDHYDECRARRGCEGPDDARIAVGPHALIGALDKAAGTTGLLVIDEPPDLLDRTCITLDELALTVSMLSAFDRDYADAMRPALQAVRAWLEAPPGSQGATLVKDAVRTFASGVDPACLDRAQSAAEVDGDAVECAASAPLLDKRSTAPPLRQVEIMHLRFSVDRARRIGTASGVLAAIYQALTAPWPVIGNVEEHVGQPVLQITAARRELTEALRREGAAVVMDANIEVHRSIYEKALGYAPPMHEFRALDGAPIERTHLWCSSASRTHWMRGGKLVPKPSLTSAVRALIAWATGDPEARRLGLITLKPIRLALEAILRPGDQAATEAWKEAGQLPGTLAELRSALGPILDGWGGEIILGHYGAVRGLNSMADVDCLATLGDPWPNVGQVARDMDYLGMSADGDARMEALCRAELEQAHGRLRTVHRTRPGRALHVGRVLPGGSGWCGGKVTRQSMPNGRPKADEVMSAAELERFIADCGSVRAAARVVDCSRAYLQQCRSGKKPISRRIAAALRELQGCNQNPFMNFYLLRGFGCTPCLRTAVAATIRDFRIVRRPVPGRSRTGSSLPQL